MTDWLPELIDDDLDTLIEALEAWETKDMASEMMGDVLDTIVVIGDTRAKAQLAEQRRTEKVKRTKEANQRKERSVLLRAKLLTLRNRRRVESVITAQADNAVREDPQ